ncbi:MAG: DUF2927 domain-containing protein [Pseudomonadota bacterium]
MWLRLLKSLILLASSLGLAGCAASGPTEPSDVPVPGPQPTFPVQNAAVPAGHTSYDNQSLADLFVRLAHDLEWGGRRPNLVRYEAPIRVGMTGCCGPAYGGFVDRFLGALRSRSGIDIARTEQDPNLIINFVPGADFRARLPAQLCVVAPGRLPWASFRESPRRNGMRSFETRRSVSAMSIYIPDTIAPYATRICLIEEITQALGLANDLNGLGSSIFNDDGAHIWPTRLDHLMLRVLYASGMQTGLNRQTARVRAKAILDRINPQGRAATALPTQPAAANANWSEYLKDAVDPRNSTSKRRRAAEQALAITERHHRGASPHCRALRTVARLDREDAANAYAASNLAVRVCRSAHGETDIRLALVRLEMARAAYRLGRASEAWGLSEDLAPTLAAHGQGERLVALYALQAAALGAIQRPKAARDARANAAAWAAYALGRGHPDTRRLSQN